MDFEKMITEAKKKGLTNETKMWQSVAILEEGLEALKESHPDVYWKIMRDQHRLMYDGHYSEEFAQYDIDRMHSTDRSGVKNHGAHWSKNEVVSATSNKPFPQGVTDCDKWVAYNAMWHDLNRKFDDTQILEAAYLFFFADEDWSEEGTKIWDYMSLSEQ